MAKSKNNLSFEEALEELEKRASMLENGNLTLDESIKIYKEVQEFALICDNKLKNAELTIKSIDEEEKEQGIKNEESEAKSDKIDDKKEDFDDLGNSFLDDDDEDIIEDDSDIFLEEEDLDEEDKLFDAIFSEDKGKKTDDSELLEPFIPSDDFSEQDNELANLFNNL